MTPMKRVAVRWLCMGVMAWVAGAGVAQATLVLEGTRIVYPEKAKDVSIRVRNPGSYPILAQSWLDDGRPDLSPEVMVVPFIVSPALTRVEPDGSALLRVFHAKRPLPTDRESLFYLNVMETPPRSSEENALTLQFRTRVKLFFRPTGLSGDAGDAPDSLKWTLVPGAGAVEVHNPTPYHVSFLSVELETAGVARSWTGRPGRHGGAIFQVAFSCFGRSKSVPGQSQIHYWAINDFGGRHSYQRPCHCPDGRF